MQLSEEIKQQAERYEKTGAFHLSHPQKVELSNTHKELFGGGVNTSCNTCVATALSKVFNELKRIEKQDAELQEMHSNEIHIPSEGVKSEKYYTKPIEDEELEERLLDNPAEEIKTEFKGVKEYTLKELKPLKVAELKKIAKEVGAEVIGKQTKTEIIKSIIKK